MTFSTSPSPGVTLQGGGSSGGGGAASLPISGNGATITASTPLIDGTQTWDNAAVTFTGAKLNITDTASNAASLLMDLQVGSSTRFSVNKLGYIRAIASSQVFLLQDDVATFSLSSTGFGGTPRASIKAEGFQVSNSNHYAFTNATSSNGTVDLFLTRRGAANLRLGAADAAGSATVTITIATPGVVTWSGHGLSTGTPVIFSTTGALPTGITAGTTYYVIAVDTNTFRIATSLANALAGTAVNTSGSQSGTQTGSRGAITQTSSVQSVVAGTTNFPGADKIITGSQGTGTGAGGSLIFQVAPAGSSGTAQNALATALTINGSSRNVNVTTALTFTDTNYSTPPGITAGFCGGNDQFDTFWQGNQTVLMGLRYDTGLTLASTVFFGFANTTGRTINQAGNIDTRLYRDAANTLALRNGTAAQTFNVYNTFTDASNYERGFVRWSSSRLGLGVENAGTGSRRALDISGGSISFKCLSASDNNAWFMLGTGDFVAATDNTYDIGASGANRPRNVYVAGSATVGSDIYVGRYVVLQANRANFSASSSGVVQIANDASPGSGFGRLQFGGTTSSFPALKRDTTSLQARLADDSAFTNIQGKLTTETAYTAGAPTATGYIIIYDSTGTAYRVPAVAN
jgi:hypothetical protein